MFVVLIVDLMLVFVVKSMLYFITLVSIVRKIRLIQPMVITLEGGGVNRVMVTFCKFKLCEYKRQLYASI